MEDETRWRDRERGSSRGILACSVWHRVRTFPLLCASDWHTNAQKPCIRSYTNAHASTTITYSLFIVSQKSPLLSHRLSFVWLVLTRMCKKLFLSCVCVCVCRKVRVMGGNRCSNSSPPTPSTPTISPGKRARILWQVQLFLAPNPHPKSLHNSKPALLLCNPSSFYL